jgi:hypothetical protein
MVSASSASSPEEAAVEVALSSMPRDVKAPWTETLDANVVAPAISAGGTVVITAGPK